MARERGQWTIHRHGTKQASFPTHEAALRHARAFAGCQRVDVWLTLDGRDLVKLPDAPTPSAPRLERAGRVRRFSASGAHTPRHS